MRKMIQLVTVIVIAGVIAGCQSATQPGRANTQTTTLKDNSKIGVDQSVKAASSAIVLPAIPAEGYSEKQLEQLKEILKLQQALNEKTLAGSETGRTYGDVFTQNQMIENSGSEANNPTATSTPSVTTPIDVSWGAASKGGSSATAASLLEKLTGSKAAASTNSTDCAGGKCSDTPTVPCTTGTCPTK